MPAVAGSTAFFQTMCVFIVSALGWHFAAVNGLQYSCSGKHYAAVVRDFAVLTTSQWPKFWHTVHAISSGVHCHHSARPAGSVDLKHFRPLARIGPYALC